MKPTAWTPAPPLASDDPLLTTPAALAELLRAYHLAHQQQEDLWQFAVGITGLQRAGLTDTELRGLVSRGYAEHALECTQPDSKTRCFRQVRNLKFTEDSCFVLTEAGCALAERVGGGEQAGPAAAGSSAHSAPGLVPCWDRLRRSLLLGAEVIKEFRRPAPAQETILDAFQEEGWPAGIDNPLGSAAGRLAEERLHDAINKLNAGQQTRRLHFRSTNGGQGVLWRLLPRPAEVRAGRCLNGNGSVPGGT
jgi:hypothetical protein